MAGRKRQNGHESMTIGVTVVLVTMLCFLSTCLRNKAGCSDLVKRRGNPDTQLSEPWHTSDSFHRHCDFACMTFTY